MYIDPWYEESLACPIDHSSLKFSDGFLVSSAGRKYPVVGGVPVMLVEEAEQTMGIASASLKRAQGDESVIDQRAPDLYLESLGISEAEKEQLVQLVQKNTAEIDPVVSFIVGATGGYTYEHLIGRLKSYPIPKLRLPSGENRKFLELGCNWGRWCIAAAHKGYSVCGVDPSLGAIMTARRVAQQLGIPIKYVVGDARFLPLKSESFDTVFSYSVLQHLSKDNATVVLSAVARVLKPGGVSLIQMPNFLGVRSLQHQIRRRFRKAVNFEVRYWSLPELKRIFDKQIGETNISVDCYFGLGLQEADIKHMPFALKCLISFSEFLRKASRKFAPLKYLADSVYVESIKSL